MEQESDVLNGELAALLAPVLGWDAEEIRGAVIVAQNDNGDVRVLSTASDAADDRAEIAYRLADALTRILARARHGT